MLLHAHVLLPEAVACYERAMRLAPADPSLAYLAGVAYASLDPPRAEPLLRRALELSPRFVPALVRRARVLRALGRPVEAERSYRDALALDPDSPAALTELATLELERSGDAAAALARLDRAARRGGRSRTVAIARARALARLGRTAEADAEATRARGLAEPELLVDPLMEQVRAENLASGAVYSLAGSLREAGRLGEAIASLDRLVAARPGDAVALNNRAVLHLAGGTPGERALALADLDAALRLDPRNVAALGNRAAARLDSGDRGGADADVRAALALDPAAPAALAVARRLIAGASGATGATGATGEAGAVSGGRR